MRTRHSAPYVLGATVSHFAPGRSAVVGDYEPGDFILTHGRSVFSWFIRFGQRLRFWGADRRYTWWSHAALIASADGALIEALGAGVQLTDIGRYSAADYHIVRLGPLATGADRDEAVAFGRWTLGQQYGWLTIISIAISLLGGGHFSFFFDGQFICSGLVARALERTRVIFDRSPSHIMPADLARYFNVEPPLKGSVRGIVPPTPRRTVSE